MCPVCVSLLLSHTVLSELYQEKWIAEDDEQRMKEENGPLSDRLVLVQLTRHSTVQHTADVLVKYGHERAARLLRGW